MIRGGRGGEKQEKKKKKANCIEFPSTTTTFYFVYALIFPYLCFNLFVLMYFNLPKEFQMKKNIIQTMHGSFFICYLKSIGPCMAVCRQKVPLLSLIWLMMHHAWCACTLHVCVVFTLQDYQQESSVCRFKKLISTWTPIIYC